MTTPTLADIQKLCPFTDARARWPKHGAWKRRELSRVCGVVLHQTGGGDDLDALHRYHAGPNHISSTGMPSIAYTWFVNKAGEVFLCNDLEDVTWSQGTRAMPGDENVFYMSVCFGGAFKPWPKSSADPTDAQMGAADCLWRALKAELSLTDMGLFGHYHFGKPACPGDRLREFIETTRGLARVVPFDLSRPAERQRALNDVMRETLKVDGLIGPATRRVLAQFQQRYRLPLTGDFDQLTLTVLHRALYT